jgi:site-specific recombinase XerD
VALTLPRHVFASERLRTGANLHQVQESLGHKHLDPTRGFTHVTAHGLRSAVKRLRRSEPRAASKRR